MMESQEYEASHRTQRPLDHKAELFLLDSGFLGPFSIADKRNKVTKQIWVRYQGKILQYEHGSMHRIGKDDIHDLQDSQHLVRWHYHERPCSNLWHLELSSLISTL